MNNKTEQIENITAGAEAALKTETPETVTVYGRAK